MLTGEERAHGRGRRIGKSGVATPLLVPSFSSGGFPVVAEIFNEMKDKLYGVCLVSASDLASGCLPVGALDTVNVMVVDSGMYEARRREQECVVESTPSCGSSWSRERYLETAANLDVGSNAILVNYDGYEPLDDQIKRASDDFSHAPHAAHDFLVKPEAPARLVNVARLSQHGSQLGQFDVLGITAREAGDSLTQRCRTVVMLRDALYDAGLVLPIHVFGAITPQEILAYFFCGADVFDGLNWLRLLFREDGPIPIEATAFEGTNVGLTDWELHTAGWTSNLRILYRLQTALQRYCSDWSLDDLARDFPLALQSARIAELAGAVISSNQGVQSKWAVHPAATAAARAGQPGAH